MTHSKWDVILSGNRALKTWTPTQDTKMIKDPPFCPSQTRANTIPGALLRAQEASKAGRTARKASREAETVTLPFGAKVYPDCPPGVGWVLEVPRHPKRYWATKELALARYDALKTGGLL